MTFPADIRVNAAFPFPALVQGNGPVTVAKASGIWTIGFGTSLSLSWTALQIFNAGITTSFIGYSTLPVNALNDGAAAAAGVAIGQTYRNGSVLMVRVA